MKDLEFLPTSAPSLREHSRKLEVEEVTTLEFQAYLDALTQKMIAARGVGLASPQIGENIRAIVIQPDPFDDPVVLINPVIIKKSENLADSEEGCFSVPGIYGIVQRHKKITIRAINRYGRRVEFEAKNFEAFVLQHEIDHLDGILFTDKAEEKVMIDADGKTKRVH
ncbi:MAG: peptide deformylase [Candidatus Uhrbacteria bacterium]